MKKLCLLLLSAVFCFVSCYDDSALQQSVTDLEGRVETLEQKVNANVESIAGILKAIDEKNFVTGVTEIKEGSKVVGYEIKLTKGNPIKIYNGESPVVGVKKDADGLYYWTVNGEWLLDGGKKVKASAQDGKDGADGKDAVLPQLKIEEGMWYIKVEGGEWTKMGQATGDSFFKDVKVGENDVTITLADGQAFVLPLKAKLAIEFTLPAKPAAGATVEVPYVIKGAAGKTQVKAICQNGWAAKVTPKTYAAGTIAVTAPATLTADEIVILVSDEEEHVIMSAISWTENDVLIASVEEVKLPFAAGKFTLTFDTNIKYEIAIAEPWLKVAPATKAIRTDVVEFVYEENPNMEERKVAIELKKDGKVLMTIPVTQAFDNEHSLNFLHAKAEITGIAGEYTIPVVAKKLDEWTATSNAEWATVTKAENAIVIKVAEHKGEARAAEIKIEGKFKTKVYTDVLALSQIGAVAVPDMLDVVIADDGNATDASPAKTPIFNYNGTTRKIQKLEDLNSNAAIFSHPFGGTATSGYTFLEKDMRPKWQDGYTLEAYVMTAVAPNGKESKALSSTRDGGTALMIAGNKQLCFLYNGNEAGKKAWRFVYTGVVPEPGRWYHLVGTWDQKSGISRVYLDGKLMKEENFGKITLYLNNLKEKAYMTIGGNSSGDDYTKPLLNGAWEGGVTAARMYSDPLTPDQVKAAYINLSPNKIRLTK